MSFDILEYNKAHEMEWPIVVNSKNSWIAASHRLEAFWQEHKHISIDEPRIGPDRSLDQNALLSCWVREVAAYMASKIEKDVSEEEFESMKRKMKHAFYNDTGSPWMVLTLTDPMTGQSRQEFRSSKKYKRGEMFVFLTWMQAFWAKLGVILESKGEFNKLQREQSA